MCVRILVYKIGIAYLKFLNIYSTAPLELFFIRTVFKLKRNLNENGQKTELTKLRMRQLNLSHKGITDDVLRDMRFDEDITYIYLGFNSIQNLENVRFPDG